MARSLLVHDALKDGRLVRALPPSWDMPSSKAHIVRWPAALTRDERVRRFVKWAVAEAEKTTGQTMRGGRRAAQPPPKVRL
jgi:LysR family glycine cleavage system transcriptional activator